LQGKDTCVAKPVARIGIFERRQFALPKDFIKPFARDERIDNNVLWPVLGV
jgi:hypothetical protein